MKDIIWSKEELKYIKSVLNSKTTLNIDGYSQLFERERPGTILSSSIFYLFKKEIEDLYYLQDIEKIEEVLCLAKTVEADPNNRSHYGLIMALSKINPSNHDKIFLIFHEIICKNEQIIHKNASELMNNIDIDFAIELVRKNENFENIFKIYLEKVEFEFEEILKLTNGVSEHEIFMPLITKIRAMQREIFIKKLCHFIDEKLRKENHDNKI